MMKREGEADRYRYERAREIEKLQERRDELQQERQDMLFGNEQNKARLMEIGLGRLNAVREAELETAEARQNVREIDPITWQNFLPNLGERIGGLFNLAVSNMGNFFSRFAAGLAGGIETAMPSSFAQIMTNQMRDVALKKYEGTTTEAAIRSMIESLPTNMSTDPIFAQMWQNILDDENYAMLVPAAVASLESKIKQEVDAGDIGEDAGRAIFDNVVDMIILSDLPADLQARLAGLFASLDLTQIESVTNAFSSLGNQEIIDKAYERFIPLLDLLGEFSAVKLPSFGNKTIIESLMGDKASFDMLAKNDKLFERLMDFFKMMEDIDPELQIRFLDQFKNIPDILNFMSKAEKVKFKEIVAGFKNVRNAFKGLSAQDITPEALKDFDKYGCLISNPKILDILSIRNKS